MASFAASLLDELMGRNRNADPTEDRKALHWSDPEVCKMFLCGFCPHELFTNTKSDLGPCSKIHDEELAKKYKESHRCTKMGYEEEFLLCLQTLIGEIERKIRRGHQRLELNKAHAASAGPIGIHQEKLKVLSDRITELVEQAEKLGSEGRIEEAQGVVKLCDQLKEERTALQESASDQMTAKEMEVCPVCGSFLVVGDAPQRVEEHVSGKQHAGYAKVRDTIDYLKKKIRGEDPEREERLNHEREERDRQKERERAEEENAAEKSDSKDVEAEANEKSASLQQKSRSRSREREERSKSHSSRHRSRSRSRHGSRRSRSRSLDRRRHPRNDRRSRSRSKDRHRSSRHDDRRSCDGDRYRDGGSSRYNSHRH